MEQSSLSPPAREECRNQSIRQLSQAESHRSRHQPKLQDTGTVDLVGGGGGGLLFLC